MEEPERTQAPFNMALYTLESIRKWIDRIAEVSVGVIGGEKIDPNELIVIKYRMVKQLIMLSTPLLSEKELAEIEEYFSEIKLHISDVWSGSKWIKNIPVYTTEVDYDLDECVQGIEKALQDSGHFMPGPDESALF